LNIDKEVDPPTPFDENDFNRMSNDVWIGAINNQVLPEGIYLKTAKYLRDGIDLAPVVDEILVADLTNNIYVFSGAKTYQQTRAMTAMLADPELQSNFYKFKEAVRPMFTLYNEDYLQAEYQTAKASARMASDWKRIEADADVLPLLQYQTVGDGRVRPTHAALDNIIRPISDPFWKQYYPPNGWRCRCTVIQLAQGEETDLSKFTPPEDVPPLFRMNAGIDGYVFKEKGKDKHPYFDIAKGDKEAAKKNWNLPIPQAPRPAPSVKVPKVPNPFKPTETLKAWGVELDERLFDMLDAPITLHESKKGAYANCFKNEAWIDKGSRYQKSKRYQKSIYYHEIGHIIHYQKGLIKPQWMVNDEYAKHFNELKKLIGKDGQKIQENINEIVRKAFNLTDEAERLVYLKKYNCENVGDIADIASSASDALMALTNGRHGAGHTKAYMKTLGMKEAEMFAHSMENFFDGNEIFEEVMPEVFKESKKYIQTLIK
jgi:SPP1 gp7 family putative phage head morphogenesis protein